MSTHAWLMAVRLGLALLIANIFSGLGGAQTAAQPAAAPPSGTCSPTDYKILTANAVAIKCDTQPTRMPNAGGQLVLVAKNGQNNQVLANVRVVLAKTQDWLLIVWNPATRPT